MNKIASALVKAQKAFGPALKSNTNPHFKSKYADLSVCVEAVIDALNENGIMLMQHTHECDDGVIVETVFIHESGETLSNGKLHVPASKQDAQGYGSALTYARRYSLMAACGIAPEDDDGNAASSGNSKKLESAKSVSRSVWDELSPEEQTFLTGIAMNMIAFMDEGNMQEAYRLFYKSHLDNEQRAALWSRFDSKQRSAIKSYKESIEKEAA